jgi:hypothetical protein
MKEQIEEMAKVMCGGCADGKECMQRLCADWYRAEELYNAGYREQEQNVVTNEQSREAIDRILNFCEEIDNHIPTDEKTGYKMLPDYFIVSRYLNEAGYRKQSEGEWIVDGGDLNRRATCPNCKHEYAVQKGMLQLQNFSFCPNCGAKMKGENNE